MAVGTTNLKPIARQVVMACLSMGPTPPYPRPCGRHNSRPCTRWDDDITQFLEHVYIHRESQTGTTPHWRELTIDDTQWTSLETDYTQYTKDNWQQSPNDNNHNDDH